MDCTWMLMDAVFKFHENKIQTASRVLSKIFGCYLDAIKLWMLFGCWIAFG